MELNNVKEQSSLKVWKADASGNIKQSDPESVLKCDISTELDVTQALRRRGAAYELAKLMSYEEHEKIVNLLFYELQKEALEGFRKITITQVAAADREIHTRLAELTRGGLPLGPRGELPLDLHIDRVLALPSEMWLLMPKPKTASVEKQHHTSQSKQSHHKKSPEKAKPAKGPKKDFGRKRLRVPMPAQLRGGTPTDAEGKSICYGFNLGSCSDRNCKRGRHVCCAPGCFATTHNFLNHPKGG